MNDRLEELKGIVILKIVCKLLEWEGGGKVAWRHIAENDGARGSKLKDLKKISAALSDEGCRYSLTISLLRDGTAMIGWNTNIVHEGENQDINDMQDR